MLRSVLILTSNILLALSLPVVAQTPVAESDSTPDAGLVAMQQLDFLVGKWQGTGSMQSGPGEPKDSLGTELVESHLGGRVLLVQGVFREKPETDAEEARVVHHAMAMISYDESSQSYRVQSHLSNGRSGDYSGSLEEGRFVWGMELPGGQARYTAWVEDDVWHEVGEFSRDGATWTQFLTMTLDRVAE